MSAGHEPRATRTAAPAHSDTDERATMTTDAASQPRDNTAGASGADQERNAVVVVSIPPRAATLPLHTARATRRDIHVAPNLRELLAAVPATSQEALVARERRDLNEIVHGVLIIGLVISTALMLVGVVLDLVLRRELPAAVPGIGEVVGRVIALRPSGFLALGLMVLIATPIVRVIGSIGAFVYERDWRFAAITTLVLIVLTVSLLLGHG